jgi:predicted DNA-binding protein
MASGQTQVSAFISDSTKDALEQYADAHGLKKAYLIEEALLHHLQALRELPLDVIIPARLIVSRDSGQAILDRVEKPRRPTKAMRELFGK